MKQSRSGEEKVRLPRLRLAMTCKGRLAMTLLALYVIGLPGYDGLQVIRIVSHALQIGI